jgi:hypothetical protein
MRWTGIEKEVEICATNITNKTKCSAWAVIINIRFNIFRFVSFPSPSFVISANSVHIISVLAMSTERGFLRCCHVYKTVYANLMYAWQGKFSCSPSFLDIQKSVPIWLNRGKLSWLYLDDIFFVVILVDNVYVICLWITFCFAMTVACRLPTAEVSSLYFSLLKWSQWTTVFYPSYFI